MIVTIRTIFSLYSGEMTERGHSSSRTHCVNAQMATDISKAITSVLGKYQINASADSDDDFLTPPPRKRM